ncbi:MAG TPA: hypothetical protein VME20_04765 [Acidimicrobiales bacterium]|nr:hypothetical protein [Acidimicrobiales bacterium]
MPLPWEVSRLSGTVRELHESSPAILAGACRRLVRVLEPSDRALVLGSTQPEGVVDAAACRVAGVDVVRRRSGGGAVLVDGEQLVWVDVVVPAGDPLWDHDVGRAAWWIGETWAKALGGALEVWKGAMLRRPHASLICFAGLGPGEVRTPRGQKVVGISQRRVQAGALFQCACLLSWRPEEIVSLLALAEPERGQLPSALKDVAVGAGPSCSRARLVERFLAALQ